jgi:putative effector of murein hydrolase
MQEPGVLGPGNLLMKMLVVVVLCDAQRVFLQLRIVKRHFLEIFGTCLIMAPMSLAITASICHDIGLDAMIGRSLLARSITVPLALSITEAVDGITSITAAVVCATGLMGAALGQVLMSTLSNMGVGGDDEIARGVAQAASSHGLGTAALAESEPEALPFAALTIAAMGTLSNLFIMSPGFRETLFKIITEGVPSILG